MKKETYKIISLALRYDGNYVGTVFGDYLEFTSSGSNDEFDRVLVYNKGVYVYGRSVEPGNFIFVHAEDSPSILEV